MNAHRQRIVAEARRWLGTPYVHQASCRGAGCDCLGLVRGVWRAIHGAEPEAVPPYTPHWAEEHGSETLLLAALRHMRPLWLDARAATLRQAIHAQRRLGLADWPCQPPIAAGRLLLFRWREDLPVKHAGIATGADAMIHAHERTGAQQVPLGSIWRRRLAGVFDFPISVEAR